MGVRFTPLEGRIFDCILNAGDGGISNDDLYDIVLSGRQAAQHTLNVHIANINDRLADTGYQVVGRDVRCLKQTGGRYHASDALSPEQQKAFGL